MQTRQRDAVEQRDAGGPATPLDVGSAGWRDTLRRTAREIKQDRISITAAGVAFYWFLSVFPLLFAAVGGLALFNASPALVGGIKDAVSTALPGDAAGILTQAIANAQSRAAAGGLTALLIGIALAVWSASSGMAATQVGLDVAYDVPEDRTFVKKRLMAIVLIIAALVLGGLSIALVVFGQPLGEFVRDHVPAGEYFVWLWTIVRWVLASAAVETLFALFYFIGPNRKPPSWAWISPGGVLGAAMWIAASLLFSLYVSYFGGSYAKTYGALAGVVVLVLWLFLAALAVLIGAELNGELERQRTMKADAEGRAQQQQQQDGAVRVLRRSVDQRGSAASRTTSIGGLLLLMGYLALKTVRRRDS
jgi:membrane protein